MATATEMKRIWLHPSALGRRGRLCLGDGTDHRQAGDTGHRGHFEGPNETPKVLKGGTAREPKGQRGAAQDSLALETGMLTRNSSSSGVTSMTAWEQKHETHPGSGDLGTAGRAPAHAAAPAPGLPNPSDAAAGHRALLPGSPRHPLSPGTGSRGVGSAQPGTAP